MKPNEELRAVLAEIVPRHRERWGDADEWEGLVEFQRELGARGWSAPAWPVEIGGRGLGVEDQIDCDKEFRRARAPRRVAVFGTNNVGPTIAAAGTPEQKVHLARILSAEEVWCQGFSEPDAGSDLAGLRCRAELDGDDFVVNGTKVWTSIGLWATHCMLLVRTDPTAPSHRGISALLVPLDQPGITRSPIVQANGEADFAEMHFEDVRVPVSALLGPVNEGWRVTMTTLGYERAGVIGLAGDLVDEVDQFLHEQGARGTLTATRRDQGVSLYSRARILAWLGERALVEDGRGPNGGVSSLIKLAWSSLGQSFAEYAADVDGLGAIAGDTRASLRSGDRLVSSRSNTIAGGTTEVMKNIIGERSLGLPREPRP
jgi:alkylation response protein AidB-like acyl-CoA dehydrogenase